MDFQEDELEEIFRIFRVESEEIIERLNNTLLELEKFPTDKDLIVLLFRDAHSLKGAARMIGFNTTQDIAHKVEDILGLAKEDKIVLTSQIADILYKSVDLMSNIIDESLDVGKEVCTTEEVKKQIKLLEDIQNNKLEKQKKVEAAYQQAITGLPLSEIVAQDVAPDKFSKEAFIKNINRINFLVVNTIINIIKLSENIERENILNVLENTTELKNIFEEINHFDIKSLIEDVRLKLDIIVKCDTELTSAEVDEMQAFIDKIVTELNILCDNNGIKRIDYYGYAFDGKDEDIETIDVVEVAGVEVIQDEENSDIITEEEPILTKFEDIDFNEVLSQVKTLEQSNIMLKELISTLDNIKSMCEQEKFLPLLNKILELLKFVQLVDIKLEESVVEILCSCVSYCFSILKKENAVGDMDLLMQQLTVAKQLVELSSPIIEEPTAVVTSKTDVEKFKTIRQEKAISSDKKVKDFSKIFNTGEIKTLHVESSKLDVMVSQIGELISTKIKATKQLSELSNVESVLEDWQRNFAKALKHLKIQEKKIFQDNDISSKLFVKQFISTLSEQNRKLTSIITNVNQIQRSNIENDMKMRLLIDDFDGMIKNIRILPLATVFHLFGRMVRDIAKEGGKEVELSITGSETSADKKIIEEIKNPLIHIIRNSIDHGIETRERRKELGKTPVGHIQINAKHQDNKILIEISDDGQGFNIQKIKDKAIQKGFLTEEEIALMSDEDIINIVFLPGFTTGDEVTSISGRGIGMDIVKSKIAQLNGVVKVISEYNKGSKVLIELPVTMATLTAFLIQASNQTFAIPMSVIDTVICKREEEILNNHDTRTVIHNGKNIPVYNLTDILNLPEADVETTLKTIIIIETTNKTIGIVVDKLLGEQEILHKKLSPPLYRIKNISGITTLASGETCLILNTSDIMKNTTLQNAKIVSTKKPNALADKKAMLKTKKVLIVDDSITTRTLEKNVLKSTELDVHEAINPTKAFELMKQTRFDIIVTDIEMPEMTGLEYLASLKSNELYSDIPVVVMSSLDNENTKKKAYSLGAEKFLVKGEFNQKNFIDTVTEILIKYTD